MEGFEVDEHGEASQGALHARRDELANRIMVSCRRASGLGYRDKMRVGNVQE